MGGRRKQRVPLSLPRRGGQYAGAEVEGRGATHVVPSVKETGFRPQ